MIFFQACLMWLLSYSLIAIIVGLLFAYDVLSFDLYRKTKSEKGLHAQRQLRTYDKVFLDIGAGLTWPMVIASLILGRKSVKIGK